MPLVSYGVVKGTIIEAKPETGKHPHYQIHLLNDEGHYRIAINVQSQDIPLKLLYYIDRYFQHPITSSLLELPSQFTPLESKEGTMALDYVRGNLVRKGDMKPIGYHAPGKHNGLNEKIDMYVKKAMHTKGATLYAFGQKWGPENRQDHQFHFTPEMGLHEIHMNQGNSMKWIKDDGIYQDGGLMFYFPNEQRWVAIFLAFQSQSWRSNPITGHALCRK
ncbi:DUF2278 family protein [Microbacteriaceae bacterium 4G12]